MLQVTVSWFLCTRSHVRALGFFYLIHTLLVLMIFIWLSCYQGCKMSRTILWRGSISIHLWVQLNNIQNLINKTVSAQSIRNLCYFFFFLKLFKHCKMWISFYRSLYKLSEHIEKMTRLRLLWKVHVIYTLLTGVLLRQFVDFFSFLNI